MNNRKRNDLVPQHVSLKTSLVVRGYESKNFNILSLPRPSYFCFPFWVSLLGTNCSWAKQK